MSDGIASVFMKDPLIQGILDEMESDAVESMISADTDQDRLIQQFMVKSVREFRDKLEEKAEADLPVTPRENAVA